MLKSKEFYRIRYEGEDGQEYYRTWQGNWTPIDEGIHGEKEYATLRGARQAMNHFVGRTPGIVRGEVQRVVKLDTYGIEVLR